MTIETDRKIYETPEETRTRLGKEFIRLTDLRIDLTRVSRGITPVQSLALRYNGPLTEAININNHVLDCFYRQIRGTGDELLTAVVEHERGRLRDFFNTPLDDR